MTKNKVRVPPKPDKNEILKIMANAKSVEMLLSENIPSLVKLDTWSRKQYYERLFSLTHSGLIVKNGYNSYKLTSLGKVIIKAYLLVERATQNADRLYILDLHANTNLSYLNDEIVKDTEIREIVNQ